MTLQLVFSFDTTGSMYPCLAEVRNRLTETIPRLFKEIDDLEIGLITHGDYCDNKSGSYVCQQAHFTSDITVLHNAVLGARRTHGGDHEECYELVLERAREFFHWKSDADKALVMIADDIPHTDPSEGMLGRWGRYNDHPIVWRQEAAKLANMGVTIYTVQCMNRRYATSFYEELSRIGNGHRLTLDRFSDILQFLSAIAYHEVGLTEEYEERLKVEGMFNRSLAVLFDTIMNRRESTGDAMFGSIDGLYAVPAGRFQTLTVIKEGPIRDFVIENGAAFKKGRGFYQLTKPELIQERKEVVLENRAGDLFTGKRARDLIGLPYGTRARINPIHLSEFPRVFVQSTSWNRKLVPGTLLLYEAE